MTTARSAVWTNAVDEPLYDGFVADPDEVIDSPYIRSLGKVREKENWGDSQGECGVSYWP